METSPDTSDESVSYDITGGLVDDPETHVHWLLPVVGVLLLMAVSLAGARWFWLFVLSREG